MTPQISLSTIFFLYILYPGSCFIVAIIGKNKSIGYWRTFFLSMIMTPFFGAILAIVSERKDKNVMKLENETKKITETDKI